MVILGGWVFLMSEVPLLSALDLSRCPCLDSASVELQGYLTDKKHPPSEDHPRSLGIGLM